MTHITAMMIWDCLTFQLMIAMLMVVIQETSSQTLKVNGIVQKQLESCPVKS
jgi:hypothetical protein